MGTIKVSLPEPMTIDGKEVRELEFREPLGADIEGLIGTESLGKSVTKLASSLCTNIPLSEDEIRAMSAKNYLSVSEVMMGFLG
ncbi:phage tail assembly protein [Nitratifractor salsuginis]|uniref:Phage tail assembly protein n=1 Tax=Nitratifractor salsuginis (strain DSM 16511 / JCM 12458 / E9I37-1) TaxID=749222 RepID=E6X1M6_NITSE|nr:phage tail assembly protein [Nitratifractor salsuginis]ADV47017.1 hypothetical protein Nitsa_1772 [Nitratifractor salsuginis DSM 16511]